MSVKKISAVDPLAEATDPLTLHPHAGLLSHEALEIFQEETLETLLTKEVFARPEPPRFVLLIPLDQLVLMDRTKWNSKRFFHFDLNEIFSRRDFTAPVGVAIVEHKFISI